MVQFFKSVSKANLVIFLLSTLTAMGMQVGIAEIMFEEAQPLGTATQTSKGFNQLQLQPWANKKSFSPTPYKFPINFEGASISKGVGANFSLTHRLLAHLKDHPHLMNRIQEILGNKRVVILVDYFFVTNFPYWSNLHDKNRESILLSHLQNLENKYDYIIYSHLPNDQMLFSDTELSKKEWQALLDKKNRKQLKNQLSRYWAAKVVNPFPLRVRDEINRYLEKRAQQNPRKYFKIPLGDTLREWIRSGSAQDSFGNHITLESMFSDHIHFNDLGQSVFLNSAIIPSLEKALNTVVNSEDKSSRRVYIPRLDFQADQFDEEWLTNESEKIFSSESDFLEFSEGTFKLYLENAGEFFASRQYISGRDKKSNPIFSFIFLKYTIPVLIELYSNFTFINSIPIFRDINGTVLINMGKPIQSAVTPLQVIRDGEWVGYIRDYMETQGGLIVNYRVKITKNQTAENSYTFSWEIFPQLPGQSNDKIRGPLSQNEAKLLEKIEKNLNRLKMQGNAKFY